MPGISLLMICTVKGVCVPLADFEPAGLILPVTMPGFTLSVNLYILSGG